MPFTNPTMRLMSDHLPMKGELSGVCHRIGCDNPGAHWFNDTNGKYYCTSCARTFNDVCRRHGQPPLCELRL
jgi:hypothetical protein